MPDDAAQDVSISLFDDMERTDDGPATYAETTFPYWNRTARRDIARVRDELEGWFERYPLDHKRDLRARFRSIDDVQHRSAAFELFLHEFLLRLGCTLVIHPDVPGTTKQPDFRVEGPDGSRLYLEAKVVTDETKEQAGERARINQIYDAINGLDSPDFWINVDRRANPTSLVRTRKLRSFLEREIAKLDYDAVTTAYAERGLDGVPKWSYESEGWIAEISVLPKGSARGEVGLRPLGLQTEAAQWIDTVSPLRAAILEKAKRYGTPDLPFVVAINYLGAHIDEDDEIAALIGDEQWVFTSANKPGRLTFAHNGVWTSPNGRYTRLSGVLIFRKLEMWNFPRSPIHLYHHPLATNAAKGPLTTLPQYAFVDGILKRLDGRSISEVFGIPDEWLEGLD